MKKGAIFDMDGLMFDTERLYQTIWNEFAQARGITLGEGFAREIGGTSGDLLRSVIVKYYHTEDPDGLFAQVLEEARRRLRQSVPLKPGLSELLDYLRENHVTLAVASSSPIDLIRSNLRVSECEPYFDQVISGHGLKRCKPFPDVFLNAAEELRLPPADCYVLEDSINGVLAGLAAGCTTIMVPDYSEPTQEIIEKGAKICSSLLEVRERIEQGEF